jgi:PAS domain S-box-containing protein
VLGFEAERYREDGSKFWTSLNVRAVRDPEGAINYYEGTVQDITNRKQAQKQSTIFSRLGYHLSGAVTAEQAAKNVLDLALELFGWDAGYVHLYSEEDDKITRMLTLDTVNGERVPTEPARTALDPTPLMRWVMKEGARLINRSANADAGEDAIRFGDISRSSACKMYVPIRFGESAIGIVSIQSYTDRAYSPNDLSLFQTLADHCGDAFRRIKVAEALREAETKYRSIFENATEGIFQTTPGGRYLSANPALARMFGFQSAAQLLSSIKDIEKETYVVPERRKALRSLLERTGSVHGFEAERYRKDGSTFWISINARAVRDSNDHVLYYEGTNQDITDRKRAELVLRESEQRFRTLFESSCLGIALHDANGHFVNTNPAYQQMLGYKESELRALSVKQVTYPEDIGEGQRLYQELRDGKRDYYRREKRYFRKDGGVVWAQSSASAIRNMKGELQYIISTVEDITERKQAQGALLESERKLRLIAENTSDVIFAFDMERRPVYINPAVERLTGYTFPEIKQKKFVNWIHAEDQSRMLKLWDNLFDGKGYSEVEFRLITKDGQLKWCSSTWGPLLDENGKQIGVQGRERDITERKVVEEETRRLSQRIIEVQEAERLRVARELHDGVNQIIASAKMRLRKVEDAIPALNPAAREILGRCEQLLVRALEENRRIAHNLRPSDLDALGLAAACRSFCKEIETRTNLSIKSRITGIDQRLPQDVELNLFRIVQEAFNNIEKHAQAKLVRLWLGFQDDSIVLRVQDDGRGFKPGAGKSAKRKGHGVGLTNIRERTASLGGVCEVKTAPKKGTRITVRVPRPESK